MTDILNNYSIEKLKEIKTEIEKYDKKTQIEILKLLYKNNVKYSENKNGVFINLIHVEESIIKGLEKYLVYLKRQEEDINIIESQKEKYKHDFFE